MVELESAVRSRFALSNWQCRALLVLLLFAGFWGHLKYLQINCPIDLAGDEAQYWDWSTRLQWNYYSKGPLAPAIIRASCAMFGDSMQAVRYPALVLAVGTSVCMYYLTRKLFQSEMLALAVVLLSHFVPMFIAGSLLMTIDPPLLFCWALASCFVAKVMVDGSERAWIGVGLAMGLGFLAKYSMPLWLLGVVVFMLTDRQMRRQFLGKWFWLGMLTFVIFTIPVIRWNMQNDWMTYKHVSAQTGMTGRFGFSIVGPIVAVLGQVGLVNPFLAIAIFVAVGYTLSSESRKAGCSELHRRGMRLLLCIGGVYWLIAIASAFISKMQPNWPAPAYFTLLILAGYVLSNWMIDPVRRKSAMRLSIGTIVLGALVTPILYDSQLLLPMLKDLNTRLEKPIPGNRVDFANKLKGNRDLALHVASLSDDNTLIISEDYQVTALLRFYLPGHPRTYYTGSYLTDPKQRRRMTQYDLWDDCRLDQPEMIGKDAIYVGGVYDPITSAFEKIEPLPDFVVERNGIELRRIPMARGRHFLGLKRPTGGNVH